MTKEEVLLTQYGAQYIADIITDEVSVMLSQLKKYEDITVSEKYALDFIFKLVNLEEID